MTDRPELGFLLSRLMRDVIRGEEPILAQHGLQMWDHVILTALGGGPAQTQAELAAATGRDKTRLIRNLDNLEQRDVITRRPDPADRRNRIVALTPSGSRTLRACQKQIRAMEESLLAGLPARDQERFLGALQDLATRAERG